MDSRMCSYQKCIFWQRGAEPTCKGPERLLRRPRSPTWTSPQLTTSAFLESSSLCHVLCECHNKAGPQVGTNVDIPSSTSFFVQRIFLRRDTHRQSHWKGSYDYTADPSPSYPCSRRRDRRSELRKARRTKHENKESVSKKLSLLILNLEEGDITLVGLVAWKRKCCLSLSTSEAVQLLLDLS